MHLIEHAAAYFGIEPQAIISHDRSKHLVRARHVCFYVMRKRFGLSYPQIGRTMHRDHSSVIYAVEKLWFDIERNAQIAAAVDHLMAVPCSRFIPAWLKQAPPKVWKSYRPEKPKPYPYVEIPAPCIVKPVEAPIVATPVACKAKNDFDSGDDPKSQEVTFRTGIRQGSSDLLEALRAA